MALPFLLRRSSSERRLVLFRLKLAEASPRSLRLILLFLKWKYRMDVPISHTSGLRRKQVQRAHDLSHKKLSKVTERSNLFPLQSSQQPFIM